MGRIDHEFRKRAAETAVNIFGQLDAVRRAEQVEIPCVVPVMHNGKPIEQRNVVLLRNHTHII